MHLSPISPTLTVLQHAYEDAQEEYDEAREQYLDLPPFSRFRVQGFAAAHLAEVKRVARDAALAALNDFFAPYRVGSPVST